VSTVPVEHAPEPPPAEPTPFAEAAVRRSWWAFLRATGAAGIASAGVITAATLVAVVGPLLAPDDPTFAQLSFSYVGPIGGHPLGFDGQGRDVLSRLLVGARTSMLGPLAVVVICIAVGTLLAVSAAWRRGAYDAVVSSGLDILFAFPGILLAILAATVFGAGLVAAVMALSIAYTPYVARVLRGAALRERSQQYVAALEVQGASPISICLRHLIPNMLPLVVAQATILFGYAMVDLAAISFLGLGVQPPQPDWGVMVSENQPGVVQGYPLAALAAGICIVVVVVAFNILGERLYEQAQAERR
jgi:peptide/nickel transport system permease protein